MLTPFSASAVAVTELQLLRKRLIGPSDWNGAR